MSNCGVVTKNSSVRIQETGDRRQKKSPILDTGFWMLDTPGKDEQKG